MPSRPQLIPTREPLAVRRAGSPESPKSHGLQREWLDWGVGIPLEKGAGAVESCN